MNPDSKNLWITLANIMVGEKSNLSSVQDDRFLDAAESNGILPLLNQWCQVGNIEGLGEESRNKISEAARTQAGHDLLINTNTRKILDLLASSDVPVLLLKGTPIAHLYYRQSYFRLRCDTDLYIQGEEKERIAALLAKAGYQLSGRGQRKHASKQFGAYVRSFQNLVSYFDIHWKLSNRPLFQHVLPFSECWTNRQPIPALGPNAWTPSTIDLLLHACIHRIAHGRNTERNRLIWLYDIHLLWNALDEQAQTDFIEKALDKKIGAVCADALTTCNELFSTVGAGHARDSHPIQQLTQNKKAEPTAKLINASKPRWALADLLAIEGVKNKLGFINEVLRK